MNTGVTFKANAQATKLMQPGERPFDDPAIEAQATAPAGRAASNLWGDRAVAQRLAVGVRVIAAVGVELAGTPAGSAHLAANGRNGIHDRQQLGDIVGIGRTQSNSERNALRIRNRVVFRATFRPVGGVGAGFFAPFNARTDELSTAARDQSICSAPWSRSSNTSWSFCHTPARSHSFRRRQHVIPDPHPISCGRSSHGMPVFNTNRIPASALRLSSGFRPGFFFRRGFTGINGSMISHNLSSTRGLVMPLA